MKVRDFYVIIQALGEKAFSLLEAFNPGLPFLLPRASRLYLAAPA